MKSKANPRFIYFCRTFSNVISMAIYALTHITTVFRLVTALPLKASVHEVLAISLYYKAKWMKSLATTGFECFWVVQCDKVKIIYGIFVVMEQKVGIRIKKNSHLIFSTNSKRKVTLCPCGKDVVGAR